MTVNDVLFVLVLFPFVVLLWVFTIATLWKLWKEWRDE